jgi:hypothetical protein
LCEHREYTAGAKIGQPPLEKRLASGHAERHVGLASPAKQDPIRRVSFSMSIEFPCSQCGKLLRVGDEAAGKQARCPSCGAVQGIPAANPSTQNPFGAAVPPPPAALSGTDVNPYQAPVSGAWQPADQHAVGPLQPGPIDAGDVLNRTWIIFKSQFWMVTLAAFVWWLTQTAFGAVVGQIVTISIMGVGAAAGGGQPQPTLAVVSQFMVQVLNFLFGTWMETGMAIYMLKTARGEPANVGDLFAGAPFWPSAILARFILVIGVFVGVLLLIVPGIIIALMLSQYMYLIIERKKSATEALSTSYNITDGSKLSLFVLAIAAFGVSILGLLACCVGIVPAIGFVNLMWAVAYLAMTGQPTADAMLGQPAATHSESPFSPPSP